MALANMTQEETNLKNRNRCKRIAEELEAYAYGLVYKCPDCGETFELPEGVDDKWCCPHCHAEGGTDDLGPLSLWDYFEDALDIRYLINSDRETVLATKILVAFGGPNIWVDTESRAVELYWWTDRASYLLSGDVCDMIDEWAQELFQC